MIQKFDVNRKFENSYLGIRTKEARVYSLAQIRKLPFADPSDPNYSEWKKRVKSTQRFLDYIQKASIHQILDLGCGNGWLTYKMATLEKEITALDVNLKELEQADENLQKFKNVTLIFGDIFKVPFQDEFDVIVMNAAFQYFEKPVQLLEQLLTLLRSQGEIHIIDSPIYKQAEVAEARARSHQYFDANGQPEMKAFYFHQSWSQLEKFQYEILYDPNSFSNKVKRRIVADSPFPWIKIVKK